MLLYSMWTCEDGALAQLLWEFHSFNYMLNITSVRIALHLAVAFYMFIANSDKIFTDFLISRYDKYVNVKNLR